MAKGESAYGPEGVKAAELLANRGMTPAVIAEARNFLALLGKVAEPAVPLSVGEQKAELAGAEDAVWAWYLEWSQVARVAIKQRALLRQMGFLGERAEAAEEPEPIAPNPTPPPGGAS